MTTPKRLETIDIGKALLIISVVLSHEFNSQKILLHLLNGYMLPLFFLFSGFFLKPQKSIYQFIYSRIKGIILPYISLGIIASLCYVPFYSFEKVGTLIIHELFSWQTLWFLPVIFFSNIIAFIVIKYFSSSYLFYIIPSFIIGSYLDYVNTNFWLQLDVIPVGTGLCLVGYYIYNSSRCINIHTPPRIYLIALPIYIGLIIYTNYKVELRLNHINPIIYFLICTILGLYFILAISYYITKLKYFHLLLSYIGKNTLIILAIHMPIFFNMQNFVRPLFTNQVFYKIIEMLAIFFGSIIACIIINKYFYFLIGKNKYEKDNDIPSIR